MNKVIVSGCVVLLLWSTWLLRWDMQVGTPGGEGIMPPAYVLDRWTGAVHFIGTSVRREAMPPRE